MKRMYHLPNVYSYPYYDATFHSGFLSRNRQETDPAVISALLNGIHKEASVIDLYNRLATQAPNQEHRNQLLNAMNSKNTQLNHFTELYFSITGTQPVYQINHIPFRSYNEGLQIACEAELTDYQTDRNHSLLSQYPHVQHAFMMSVASNHKNITRLRSLQDNRVYKRKDYGSNPFVVNIDKATKKNKTYRTALWTGKNLQVTLMSIDVGDDIGLEVHPNTDQFLRIEEGQGLVEMGNRKDRLDFRQMAYDDFAIMVPAGKWHNITNTGNKPMKLYAIYAPPEHPFGTVHETKADAMAEEHERR